MGFMMGKSSKSSSSTHTDNSIRDQRQTQQGDGTQIVVESGAGNDNVQTGGMRMGNIGGGSTLMFGADPADTVALAQSVVDRATNQAAASSQMVADIARSSSEDLVSAVTGQNLQRGDYSKYLMPIGLAVVCGLALYFARK